MAPLQMDPLTGGYRQTASATGAPQAASATGAPQAGKMFQDLMARLSGTLGATAPAARAIAKRPGMATAAVMAGGQLLGQDPFGAATGAIGSLGGGALASRLTAGMPAPVRIAAGIGGALLGGGLTEQGARAASGYLGAQIPPSEEVGSRSQQKREREFQREQLQADVAARSAAELAANKELYGYLMTKEIEAQKAQLPLIEKLDRSRLVNAQAMLASETAAYQQLARTAIAGKSMITGQQERGATMRQALATNPYMGSVMQAPQISFG